MSIIPHLYDIQSTLFFEDFIKKHLLPRSKYVNYIFVVSVRLFRYAKYFRFPNPLPLSQG